MEPTQQISWFHSIKAKVVLITLFLNTVILGGFAVFNAFTMRAQLEGELYNLAEVTATRLSKHVMIPLWDLDKEQVEETLRSEMLEKHIAAIVVRDSNGTTIFAGKERSRDWKVQDLRQNVLTNTQNLVRSSQPVMRDKKKIGDVEMYLSRKFLEEELRESIIKVALSSLVLDMVLLITIVMALQRLVIKPIDKLAAAAESMSMGNLDVAIDASSRDEIGYVAEAMERMRTSLQIAMRRLQQTR